MQAPLTPNVSLRLYVWFLSSKEWSDASFTDVILASEDIAPSIPPLSPNSSVLPVDLYSPVDYLSKFWRDSYNSPRTDEKER